MLILNEKVLFVEQVVVPLEEPVILTDSPLTHVPDNKKVVSPDVNGFDNGVSNTGGFGEMVSRFHMKCAIDATPATGVWVTEKEYVLSTDLLMV